MNLAPIVLFVYNRPWHTRQTVEALQQNELAVESELYIYSDGSKNEDVKPRVEEVREYIKTITGFKNVTIIEREENWGLAASIIEGVTEIVNKYGKIIVLEDDLVTSKFFLKFMNESLEYYKDQKKVWHISGWNYPIDSKGLGDTFFWRVMNCWGWATWADRWIYYKRNPSEIASEFTKKDIYNFNIDGSQNFWSQVNDNITGKLKTWAIFWYATIFKHNGLCLNPSRSFVENIGQDATGENCRYLMYSNILNDIDKWEFNLRLVESKLAIDYLKKKYSNKSLIKKIIKAVKII